MEAAHVGGAVELVVLDKVAALAVSAERVKIVVVAEPVELLVAELAKAVPLPVVAFAEAVTPLVVAFVKAATHLDAEIELHRHQWKVGRPVLVPTLEY